jgi:serine protease Do
VSELKKETTHIIDIYRDVVIQIATPFSTGTGFYIHSFDLIVTNEHVVRDNKKVVIDGKKFDKQLVDVLFVDPKFDLAFLAPPVDHEMPDVKIGHEIPLKEGAQVIAVGHPFGLKYTATRGIISNLMHKQGDIQYIQHDAALNPGNSGGPLLNMNGKVVGINTFIIRDGHNIGFSLPVQYLIDTLQEFKQHDGDAGVKCTSCLNLVFEDSVDDGYCPNCGAKIKLISDLDSYEAFGVSKTLEDMLKGIGFDVDLSRRGPNHWQIVQGSAKINISYHEETGLIVGDAYLCSLPKEHIKAIYKYLLQQNYNLEGLTFSVQQQDIIVSLLIYDQYLNTKSSTILFKHLFEMADHYDNILVNRFGAIWRPDI